MCCCHGGKKRIGKNIAEIIYNKSIDEDFKIKGYCEPFCGMLGVYQHVHDIFTDNNIKLKYKAGDINTSLIMMWKQAQKGWYPNIKINKREYDKLKYSRNSALKGFIGHHCSFGGKYFNTFRPERCKKSMINNVLDKINNIGYDLKDVEFKADIYTQYSNLKGYVIYCDPPYSSYNTYYSEDLQRIDFDQKEFWDWCKKMSKYNIIFVSEYTAPKDFKLVYSKKSVINHNYTTKNNIERLFML